MNWTDSQRADLARHYARIGYAEGELWPAPPANLDPAEVIALLKTIPDGAGREGYIAALASGGKPAPVNFVASNELSLHVTDPAVAEKFYTEVLGCAVITRTPDRVGLSSGPLKLFLVRDPAATHDAVIPCFAVKNRALALARLEAAGCTLVPAGAPTSGQFYVRDPNGIVFDVVERAPA
jgi:catechol 2,3-dioxygenase-like lactoylglutathione lyase family enzyme